MPLCNEQVVYAREAILLAPWLQPGDQSLQMIPLTVSNGFF